MPLLGQHMMTTERGHYHGNGLKSHAPVFTLHKLLAPCHNLNRADVCKERNHASNVPALRFRPAILDEF